MTCLTCTAVDELIEQRAACTIRTLTWQALRCNCPLLVPAGVSPLKSADSSVCSAGPACAEPAVLLWGHALGQQALAHGGGLRGVHSSHSSAAPGEQLQQTLSRLCTRPSQQCVGLWCLSRCLSMIDKLQQCATGRTACWQLPTVVCCARSHIRYMPVT
jgi:hypothetical protein